MQVGDRVQLNPNIDTFRYGQGSVGYGEVGTIIRISVDGGLTIDFPSNNCWFGMREELIPEVNDGLLHCINCGEVITEEESEEYRGGRLCYGCLDEDFSRCSDCGEIFRSSSLTDVNDGYGNYFGVCSDCLDENYFYCDDCCDYYHNDQMHEVRGQYYCDNCYENHSIDNQEELYDYHEFSDWELFKSSEEKDPSYYIGKEIELEPKVSSKVSRVLAAIYDNINAVGMHDGSLSYGGVEVVTHPESWEYLQEHKQDYVNFFNEIKELEYGNNGHCGLHFHVSRPNENVISRVIVLLESFKEEIFKLSRRDRSQMHWCQFLSDTGDEVQKVKYQSCKWLKDKFINKYHDRYSALNLNNSSTIEFRFFNGVNNFEEYWAALQFIHNIMEVSLQEDRDITTISWKDLIVGEELTRQAIARGVDNVDKFAKDTTDIIEKFENALAKAKKEIANTLKNLANYIVKEMTEFDPKEIKTKNMTEINEKVNTFIDKYKYRQQYLNRITDLYQALTNEDRDITMENIKSFWENTKASYPKNTGRYSRYDKLINKAIKNYESEVR